MKIKIYIVTYQGHKRINQTLKSLFSSDIDLYDYEVSIINNHTDIRLEDYFLHHPRVSILHNTLRPDWSSGHLSRNWNQALINGFKSLINPDCDMVVCSQDDSIFNPEWASRVIKLHDTFHFIQNGHGDQFHSYTPEAVKHVGLWDERFCGLSRQAADYFWRCCLYLQDHSSIQDPVHKRVLNPIFPNLDEARNWLVDADVRQLDGVWDNSPHGNNQISQRLILHKYGFDPFPWTDEKIKKYRESHTITPNFITYPYFEKDIYGLSEKGYLI